MKTRFLFIVLPFLISQSVFALNDKPAVCPSVAAIQAVSVNHVVHYPENWAAFAPNNQYDTKEEWKFGIDFQPNINEQDALIKAKELLMALILPAGEDPQPRRDGKGWGCIYFANINGEAGIGVALTPPDELPRFKDLLNFPNKK